MLKRTRCQRAVLQATLELPVLCVFSVVHLVTLVMQVAFIGSISLSTL